MRRRDLLATGASALALVAMPGLVRAQGVGQKLVCAMIGAAGPEDPNGAAWLAEITRGLAEEGWTEGGNVHVEARFTAGLLDLSERFSAELAGLGPDVWVCGTPANAKNAHTLTPDVPLVFVAVPDPVGEGLIRSFNEPGGNITGVAHYEASVGGRQMGLLLEIAPDVRNVGYIYHPDGGTGFSYLRPFVNEVAVAAGVTLIDLPVRTLGEVEPAIASVAALPGPGLFVPTNNWTNSNRQVFIDAVNRHRIPAMWGHTGLEQGLISYRADTTEAFHLAGGLAGRILNGADPRNLPVLGAPRYVLTVNLSVAASLGLTVPLSILVAADRVIE
ncbi:MAG: ABC transporter substrate-binding protein [Bauldia sp.]|nr:ABC transporter substrate-binding protein [Bauldia sp.]